MIRCLLPSSVWRNRHLQCVCKTSSSRKAHLHLETSRHYGGYIESDIIYPQYVQEFGLPLLRAMQFAVEL